MSAQLDAVLSRLEKVRRGKKGFSARCPAHSDKSASLSIALGEHGVVLKCFAGCETDTVLGAIGLTFSDLYPPRPTAAMTPEQRGEARQAVKEAHWAAALTTLAQDTLFIQAAASMLAQGQPLPATDIARLAEASGRIHHAKEVLCGRR